MNATSLSPALEQARSQWRARWGRLAPRERRLVTAAAAVVAIGIVWMLFVQPALRTLREAPVQLDQLEAQLQQMQRLAAETRSLREAPPVGASQANAALRAATERLGDKGRLTMLGDRASLTLTNASPEALRGWLLEARSAARARPVEAQLTRSGQGYSGTLVVALGSAP